MKYPDYYYVETADNGPQNRNNVMNVRAVRNYQGHTDMYMTYFRYNVEAIDYFEENGTLGKFQGPAYADWMPIDIDAKDLVQAQDQARELIERLEDYGIDRNTCRYYFSGSKGFHIMIPSGVMDASPDPMIHKRFRKVAQYLTKGLTIDTGIYDKTRLFRLPNTINSKSGLFKVELYDFQVAHGTLKDIFELAEKPGERLDIEEDYDVVPELAELFHEPIEVNTSRENNGKTATYICMQTMMAKGVPDGERNNGAIRVASHLQKHGLNPTMVWTALDEWNKRNDPPMENDRLELVYDQSFNQYHYGCHDPMMIERCDPDCLFFKPEWNRF